MAGKYWETETPETFEFGKNQFRYYKEAGKLQVYPLAPNTTHGVGRGATIDLQAMSPDEVLQFKLVLDNICEEMADDET